MGRNKTVDVHARADSYKQDKFYVNDNEILMCGICDVRLEWTKKDNLDKHIVGAHHKKMKDKLAAQPTKRQATMVGMFNNQKKAKLDRDEFITDTVEMCLQAKIPLNKLDHKAVRGYIQKYISGSGDLPTSDTLRRHHVSKCGEKAKQEVKEQLRNKPLVVVADEMSDCKGRCVFAVLAKTLVPAVKQDVFLLRAFGRGERCQILRSMSKLNSYSSGCCYRPFMAAVTLPPPTTALQRPSTQNLPASRHPSPFTGKHHNYHF